MAESMRTQSHTATASWIDLFSPCASIRSQNSPHDTFSGTFDSLDIEHTIQTIETLWGCVCVG